MGRGVGKTFDPMASRVEHSTNSKIGNPLEGSLGSSHKNKGLTIRRNFHD
jgi:hypothetical protein